ncbi:MAG: hypothetical protein ABIW33_04510 [Sphingomicrobium sp.]
MGVGALIGAYQEDEAGGLRALLPLAGRTLLEYQVRCAAAAEAAPILVVVERVPQALQDALERLRIDGVAVVAVSALDDAVSRFEAGSTILLIGDGIAAPASLIAELAAEPEPTIATLPDDEQHAGFERIDGESRWAGVALVDANLLASTAAMLGDWDFQSTLLRRTLQEGARRVRVGEGGGEPLLVERAEQLETFQRNLVAASRAVRSDWASRFITPPVEEFATERLMETAVRPGWLIWAGLILTLGAALGFVLGWPATALGALLVSAPLDLVAMRLASLRLRPLGGRMLSRSALWPAAGLAAVGLGWRQMAHGGGGWGALLAAVVLLAFAQAAKIEEAAMPEGGELWLFSRRNAIFAAVPLALVGGWTLCLVALMLYAAASFFIVQHVRHRPQVDAKLTQAG